MNTTIPHEVTEECAHVHCHSHGVDEAVGDAVVYMVCFECGHVYLSARELRTAYRTEYARRGDVGWRSTPFKISIWRYWWQLLTVRAEQISFCQECAHDW